MITTTRMKHNSVVVPLFMDKECILDKIEQFELAALPIKQSPCHNNSNSNSKRNSQERQTWRKAVKLTFIGDIVQAVLPANSSSSFDDDIDSCTSHTFTDDTLSDTNTDVDYEKKFILKKSLRDCANAKCQSLEQQLFFAVKMKEDGGYVLLQHLLSQQEGGFEIDTIKDRSRNDCSLLHTAALYGNYKCMQLLCDCGFMDLDVKDKLGSTPLHYACSNGSTEACMFLLSTGRVNINMKDSYGAFPLLIALRTGRYDLMKLLIMYDADIFLKNAQGDNALHYFCKRGIESSREEELERLMFLINDCKMSVTRLNRSSENCLFSAIGNHNIVQYLCEHSTFADLTKMLTHTNSEGRSVFHTCAEKGSLKSMQIIMKVYATKFWEEHKEQNYSNKRQLVNFFSQRLNDQSNLKAYTLLHLAVIFGHLEFARFLLQCAETKTDLPDAQGQIPLDYSISKKRTDIQELFTKSNMLLSLQPPSTGHSRAKSAPCTQTSSSSKSPRLHPLIATGTVLPDQGLIDKVVQLLEKNRNKRTFSFSDVIRRISNKSK
jgi:ankyrin repeat protein